MHFNLTFNFLNLQFSVPSSDPYILNARSQIPNLLNSERAALNLIIKWDSGKVVTLVFPQRRTGAVAAIDRRSYFLYLCSKASVLGIYEVRMFLVQG